MVLLEAVVPPEPSAMSPKNFFAELKRRNVLRAGALYLAGAWALAQGIAQLTPVVSAPDWVARWFLVAAAIGFPFWLALRLVLRVHPHRPEARERDRA